MALTTTLRMACFIRSASTRMLAASLSAPTETRMPAASAWGAARSTISRTKESSGTSAACSSTGRVKSRKVFTTRSRRRISREMISICGATSVSSPASFMRASSTCIRMALSGFLTSCATPLVIRLMAERRSAVCSWRPTWRAASGSRKRTSRPVPRPVELHPAEVPLDSFVREIVDLAAPQAEAAGIRVWVNADTDAANIRVDRDLMKQAILNVVVNAIQAMPQGGELRIECAVRDEEAEIRISDTGVGIPPELRDKIFRLYYTTKPEGSGIGLAMTFRIVQLHDGAIDFTSEPGKGTTFVVRLPVSV